MVSVGYFATLTGSFGAVKSSGDALEAQRVAEIESNKIRLTDYENLDSKVQQGKWVDAPDNPGWQYFVTLGSEKVIDGDNKQRIAEVKVRRKGDEESRFETAVPVASSDGESGKGFKEAEIKLYEGDYCVRKRGCDIRHVTKIIDGPYHHIEVGSRWYSPVDDVVVLKKSGFLEIPQNPVEGYREFHESRSCTGFVTVDGIRHQSNLVFVKKGSRIKKNHDGIAKLECDMKGSFYSNQPPWKLYYIE